MVGMEGDAQRQSGLLGSLGPTVEDVLLGTDVLRVPLLILRIPKVEIVVVIAEHEEILGATALIAFDKGLGIPLLGLEEGQDILETKL